MKAILPRWCQKLSIQWKLQLSFFIVTMITIVINRWVGYHELSSLIDNAKAHGVNETVITKLNGNLSAYLFNSVWQSAIEFAVLFMIISILARIFVTPIKALCKALEQVEKGDLTKTVPNTSLDEIGILEHSFNSMITNLSNIISNINSSGKQMAHSAHQIATISHEISDISKNEQSRSQEVASATAQLRKISDSVRSSAEEAAERSNNAATMAQDGISKVKQNIIAMENTVQEVIHASHEATELDSTAQQIHSIIDTIRDIAEQTNLLALNAAIEAARAGQEGRGFAVVADEVRNLAKRTTISTNEITGIISHLTNRIKQVSVTMASVVGSVHSTQTGATETVHVIEDISTEVSEMAAANHEITEASRKQSGQLQNLQESIDSLFAVFKTSSMKVETTATIGSDLHRITKETIQLISKFKYHHESKIESIQNERRTTPRMEKPLRMYISQEGKNSKIKKQQIHNSSNDINSKTKDPQATQTTGVNVNTKDEHQLKMSVNQDGLQLETICNDISMSGCQLRTSRELDKDHPVTLNIHTPYEDLKEYKNQIPLKITGKIVWQRMSDKTNMHLSGIKFDDLNGMQKNRLQECFDFFMHAAEF